MKSTLLKWAPPLSIVPAIIIACQHTPRATLQDAHTRAYDACRAGEDAGSSKFPCKNGRAHAPDFFERHKFVAADDSQACATCHTNDECVACHDGRVRPRSIHPNDFLSMHAIESQRATERCTSCHREQSFCLDCHQRVGVSMSGPGSVRASGRFHPPKAEWSDPPKRPGHHAYEAQRNLVACVSCHIERDCVACHASRGIGGGISPHRPGFASACRSQYRRNARPCLVCHQPGDGAFISCQ